MEVLLADSAMIARSVALVSAARQRHQTGIETYYRRNERRSARPL